MTFSVSSWYHFLRFNHISNDFLGCTPQLTLIQMLSKYAPYGCSYYLGNDFDMKITSLRQI